VHGRIPYLRSFFLVIVLVVVVLSLSVRPAAADVPVIVNITNKSYDYQDMTRLYWSQIVIGVQITHHNPSSSHYVDLIQVRFGEQVLNFSQEPQSTDPFSVDLKVGVVSQGDIVPIQVRAHCTEHGWSAWSQEVQVPEFESLTILAPLALAASLAAIGVARRRNGRTVSERTA
jgi:hypothetical protein